ncbi:autotransporter assembly complex protein TamA [Vibrio viridaestus]|uniref:Translocation and assembly module subunit TamA n=1 Tax=Vibrio viridaestus TaxID=2487322 RepID=A0A3N9TBK4_9VIBR|nr:autotransporter assembly complex family protein [Vibrio viridaestus]RQW61578.1 outer membrane protein assembly factor [Vibrio viridaestus]
MRYRSIFFSVVMLFYAVKGHAETSLEIKGLDGEPQKNVEQYLSSIPSSDYSTSLRFKARIESKIESALNALGYYNPEIEFISSENALTVNIQLGPPTVVKTVDFQLTGDAENDQDFLNLLQKSSIKEGEKLSHSAYDSLKSNIQNLALEKGYFNGKFVANRIEVSPKTNQANIILHYESGKRYLFGKTILQGSQIDNDRVLSLKGFEEGEPYRMKQISEFSQNLSSTDWFSSVLVEPDFSNLENKTELPVKVTLDPAAKNQLETGIGYSTDVGVKGTLTWNKPWLNSAGHSFTSSFSLSSPEQTITASYKIPLEDVLHEYYQIQYGLKKVDNLDTQSLESNLSLERHWLEDNGWNKTLFVRYLVENYEQGVLDDIGQFVLPGVTFSRTRTRTRNSQLITWGDKQTVTLEYGNENMLSETDILRLQASTSWIRSYGDNQRGLIRLSGGANLVDDFDKVSPSLRFFAGGDNSIRGYTYESISPKDSTDSLTGAKYLATSSIEYQYRLFGKWWGAVFYDYGDAFNTEPDFKRGTGFGIRWISPLGPLRLDFAWGLDSDPGDQFKIHFTLGPEL